MKDMVFGIAIMLFGLGFNEYAPHIEWVVYLTSFVGLTFSIIGYFDIPQKKEKENQTNKF